MEAWEPCERGSTLLMTWWNEVDKGHCAILQNNTSILQVETTFKLANGSCGKPSNLPQAAACNTVGVLVVL